MRILTRSIRNATGLTLSEFCETYLKTNTPSFQARIKGKNELLPNEVLLICLITGENPKKLFGKDAVEIFLLRGKQQSVNNHIMDLIAKPGGMEKLNLVLGNLTGLRIDHGIEKPEHKPEKKEVKKIIKTTIPAEPIPVKKVSKFDFVDTSVFANK